MHLINCFVGAIVVCTGAAKQSIGYGAEILLYFFLV